MTTNTFRQPTSRFLLRHYRELLAILATLFVIQTGLVPFSFSVKHGAATRAFSGAPVSDLIVPDIVSNLFLYLPLGFLGFPCLARRRGGMMGAGLLTVGAAAVISGGVEFLQAYAPSRVSSWMDFVSNVSGAGLGVCLSWGARKIAPSIVDAAIRELGHRPRSVLLKAYCGLLFVIAAVPFSFSFDVARFKKAVRSANVVPFANTDSATAMNHPESSAGLSLRVDYAQWRRLKRWARWYAECASFIVLSWLMLQVLQGDYGFSRFASATLMWWIATGMAIALTVWQLPILTRACDATDVVFRLIGLGIGLATHSVVSSYSGTDPTSRSELRARRMVAVGASATLVYVVYTGVIPFAFGRDASTRLVNTSAWSFLPFFSYSLARFDLMMIDVMEKFICYGLLAALMANGWLRIAGASLTRKATAVATACLTLSCSIEFVQLFISVRVTSLTDPIIAAGASLAGVLGQEHALRFYRFAVACESSRPIRRRHEHHVLAPEDEMLSTLAEPYEGAPMEPGPSGQPAPSSHR